MASKKANVLAVTINRTDDLTGVDFPSLETIIVARGVFTNRLCAAHSRYFHNVVKSASLRSHSFI